MQRLAPPRLLTTVCLLFVLSSSLTAHSLFLKLESFFLAPHTDVSVDLFNGTFEKSDNLITRDRMLDVSIQGPGSEVVHPAAEQWSHIAKADAGDAGERTRLQFRTGDEGSYTLGVSTRSRVIPLEIDAFEEYLNHDGVVDILERRQADRVAYPASGAPVRERYSKHVKAIVQVGDEPSEGALAAFGYPIEITPLQNPYELGVGDSLEFVVTKSGMPVPGQLVYGSYGSYHEHDENGRHIEAFSGRTDENGRASVPLTAAGLWYLRLIHMVESEESDVDYESNWATLTFEVAEAEAPDSVPTPSVLVLAGVAVLGLWFLFARRGTEQA